MKSIITLSAFLFSLNSFSQVEQAQIGAEFKETAGSVSPGAINVAGTHMDGMQTYSSHEVDGSQFFFPAWSNGSVTTIKNEIFSKNYLFLFDKVRQQLFMKWEDSSIILVGDKPSIKFFTLTQNGIDAHFVSAFQYNTQNSEDFYQILSSSGDYVFLKLIKTKYVKADYSDIQKVKDGDIHDAFVDNVTYFVSYKNGIPQPISFREKSLEKTFSPEKDKVVAYFNQNSNGKIDENYVVNLLGSFN